MSIMSPKAIYAKDMESGKIYSFSITEVQKDKDGKFWLYNKNEFSVYGCPPGAIMQIHPHPDSLFYYDREIEK